MPGYLLLLCLLISSCAPAADSPQSATEQPVTADRPVTDIGSIPLPAGYIRIKAPQDSYGYFLRSLHLKQDNTVFLYNGMKKRNQQAQYAVLQLDRGTKDLQQCADAVMRIRAEYLYQQKNYSDIRFDFTNGFVCDYEHYARGYRLSMKGNTCSWIKQKPESYTYPTFRQYLDVVYAYAGTKSLHRQLKSISLSGMQPGDVFIQTREPYGHAVTVMDMAYNPNTKDTVFLLSQSYMPAQDIHILINPGNGKLSPWYSTGSCDPLETPEWTFTNTDLKEF